MAERRPLAIIDGQIQQLPNGDTIPGELFGVGFGGAAQFVRSDEEFGTTEYLDFVTKLGAVLTTPVLTGTYWVEWCFEYGVSATNDEIEVRAYNTTDAEVLGLVSNKPNITNDYFSASGFDEIIFDGESKSFEIQVRRIKATGVAVARVRRARLRFWREGETSSSSSSA